MEEVKLWLGTGVQCLLWFLYEDVEQFTWQNRASPRLIATLHTRMLQYFVHSNHSFTLQSEGVVLNARP
jgi:hypothetical protein